MNIIMSMKNKLIKLISKKKNIAKPQSSFDITNNEVNGAAITSANKDSKDTIPIVKNPFLITAEDFKEIALNFDLANTTISHMNEWQRYKNKYSRTLMQAKSICRQYGK